ncbi:MAG: cytochrome P450 [Alphaproteobacteria bacterium]|nr:cytochrome P450 [Alphaproteobacteria bacterium]
MRPDPSPPQRPPGPRGLPLLGVALDYSRDPFDFLLRTAREHGDVAFVRLGGFDIYLLGHPDHIAHVLLHNHKNYVKNQFLRRASVFFGEGLLTSDGETWRRQRRLVQPAFHKERVMGYGETMVGCAQTHLAPWRDGQVRELHDDMMALTLDIALHTLFGSALRPDDARAVGESFTLVSQFFAETRANPLQLPMWVPTPSNLRFKKAHRMLGAVVDRLIEEARSDPRPRTDLLASLLEARTEDGEAMDHERLRGELITLLFAGHETTALALTFTLFHLARHPAALARLHDEVDRVLGGRPPTVSDLRALTWSEQILRESMRLHPPAYSIGRQAVQDDVIGGWRVPAGSMVAIPQWVVHRDPRYFEDPEAFRPERWTPAFRDSLHKFAYFPFGGGPRVCVGAGFAMVEMTLVLAMIAQRWSVEAVDDNPLVLAAATTARPVHPVQMRLRARPSEGLAPARVDAPA